MTPVAASECNPCRVEIPPHTAVTILSETAGLYALAQVVNYLYQGCIQLFGAVAPFTEPLQLVGRLITTVELIDLVYFTKYWVCGEFLQEGICAVAGAVMMTAATVGGAFLWLGEIGIPALAEIASTIGLVPIVCSVVAVGNIFFAADAIKTIIETDNKTKEINAVIKLVSCVADLALNLVLISLLIPGVNVPGLVALGVIIPLGLVAKGFALASFIYKKNHENELNTEVT